MWDRSLFTDGENKYLDLRVGSGVGSFFSTLFTAMALADQSNLERIRAGFPDEVAGYEAWTKGDLHSRWWANTRGEAA